MVTFAIALLTASIVAFVAIGVWQGCAYAEAENPEAEFSQTE
jgi:hypothetical protein